MIVTIIKPNIWIRITELEDDKVFVQVTRPTASNSPFGFQIRFGIFKSFETEEYYEEQYRNKKMFMYSYKKM